MGKMHTVTAQEAQLSEAHGIIAKEVARRFVRQMPLARTNWEKMKEYTQKFGYDEDERLSYLTQIQEYQRAGYFPDEILPDMTGRVDDTARTFADDWEVWIRNQYAIKMSKCTSISEVGAMMLDDVGGQYRRDDWDERIFIKGIRGGKTGICKGDPGSGKTDFVLNEIVLPLLVVPNVQVVTNIAIATVNGEGIPDNLKYATTLPQALRLIIQHSIDAIDYVDAAESPAEMDERKAEIEKHPYLTVWVVDEAGISKDKHDAMSQEWKTQRHITMISRKIKAFQMTIYQFDDAPDDIERLASHRFRKPGTERQDLVTFSRSQPLLNETTLYGIDGWQQRRDEGLPYIEYDTDDTAGMSPEGFDTQAMLNYINQLTKDGPIGSRAQYVAALNYIVAAESRNFTISTEEGDFYFLYRVKKFNEMDAARLTDESERARGAARKKALLDEAKALRVYTRWPYLCRLAKSRYPMRNFYPETLKREFEKLEEKYPEIMDAPDPITEIVAPTMPETADV